MILGKKLDSDYSRWNRKWGSPFGYAYYGGRLSQWLHLLIRQHALYRDFNFLFKLIGLFSMQMTSSTRIYEYPWAYYATDLTPNMHIIEIGGGLSGFQFVLSAMGAHVINIDPMDKRYNCDFTPELFTAMNGVYATDVQLCTDTIDKISIPEGSVDRIYCISVLEHLRDDEIKTVIKRASELLKPNGYFICTVDLFLDVYPFSDKKTNIYGRNISIRKIIRESGLKLHIGKKNKLFGYDEFRPKKILAQLNSYYMNVSYPVLSQAFVLRKPMR